MLRVHSDSLTSVLMFVFMTATVLATCRLKRSLNKENDYCNGTYFTDRVASRGASTEDLIITQWSKIWIYVDILGNASSSPDVGHI